LAEKVWRVGIGAMEAAHDVQYSPMANVKFKDAVFLKGTLESPCSRWLGARSRWGRMKAPKTSHR